MFRRSSPVEEMCDVLGHLGACSWCSVFVFNETWISTSSIFYFTIKQNSCHGNCTTREIRIIIQSFHNMDTWGWFLRVTSKERKHIICSTMSCFDHQGEIRR